MSYRLVPFTEGGFVRFVRDVYDRLARIEGGSSNRGAASFDSPLRIGDVELVCTPGNGSVAGRLSAGMTAIANTLTLGADEGAAFPEPPFTVQIEAELVRVVGRAGDTFSPLGRGFGGTSAVLHPIAAAVKLNTPGAQQVILRNVATGRESLLTVLP